MIRILIDRYPDRQNADITYRRLAPLIEEQHYAIREDRANETFSLIPSDSRKPILLFNVIRDEITRSLLFQRGDADVIYNGLSLSKLEWLGKTGSGVRIESHPGHSFSYVGFNLKSPVLSNLQVRKALVRSLPVHDWAHLKLFDWVTPLPKASEYAPRESESLLDQAGFPRKSGGIRFSLHYYTTPVREGHELASLVAEALGRIGVELRITTVETSLFYSKLLHRDFDLFSTRWIRFSENDSIQNLLATHGKLNYTGYSNPELDRRLEGKSVSFQEVRELVAQEIPFYPVYQWKHAAILGPRIDADPETASRLDETFRFLSDLRLK